MGKHDHQNDSSFGNRKALPYLMILGLAVLIYGQTLFFDFTYCDDYKNIVEEHELIKDFSRIPHAFTRSYGNLYRPVLRITYIMDTQIGGIAPFTYHASNLFFHLVASCLVFLFLSKVFVHRRAALPLSLLFTAHPLLVAAVAWVPGRNDSLVTVFILLSFLSLMKIAEERRGILYAVHLLCFALALFTKEIAALFPLLGFYYLWFLKGEKNALKILIPGWACIGLLWFAMRHAALAQASSPDLTGFEALYRNLPALPALLGKTVLPWKLSGLATFELISMAAGGAALIGIVILLARSKNTDRRTLCLGALWFLLFLMPTLFFRVHHADDHFDYMEHRAYLPAIGFLIVLGELLLKNGVRFERRTAVVATGLVLALFFARSFMYAREFKDSFAFWNAGIAHDATRSNFHSVLGKLHHDRGELEEAEACFRKAAALSRRGDPDNYYNLAIIVKDRERLQEAVDLCRKAIELKPDSHVYHHLLGKLYAAQLRYDQAEAQFRKALEIHPGHIDSLMQLISVYLYMKKADRAIATCHDILALDAHHLLANEFLGTLYAGGGQMDRAEKHWIRILELNPGHLPSYEKLMRLYIERNRLEQARYYGTQLLRRGGRIAQEERRLLDL